MLLSLLLIGAVHPARSIAALSCPELLALLHDGGAAPHDQAARWLHAQRPQLHISERVEEVIEALAQSQGVRLQKPADKISRWLEYMRLAMETEGLRNRVRKTYLEEHVLRPEEVPESHYQLQRRVARELGHGDVAITPELRQEQARTVVENQWESLAAWWDYLSSNDAKQYPAWARVFVLGEVARMGRFDAETGKFTKRDKNQVASFPEVNREALAKVISELEEHAQRGDRRTFSFSESYGRKLTEAIKERGDPAKTDGQWVKYPKGSAPEKLSHALEGWNTGWCTTDCGTAGHQLNAGDFYVYYSLDSNGLPRVPRLAIRMEGERIAEVRGVAKAQNVDSHIAATAVLDHKLAEFGGQGELYRKRSRHMRQLTAIEAKTERKEELSLEDLWFLYEMDGPIQGFGYGKDPRVAKILDGRNSKPREDLATLLAFFAGSRGKKLTEVALASYAREHAPGVAAWSGTKPGQLTVASAVDPATVLGLFRESLSTQNLNTMVLASRLVPDKATSADFRTALVEAYVANADPSRLAREVVRYWGHEDEEITRFAKEVLAVSGHTISKISLMRAFNEIEKISNDAQLSHQNAAERWLSDPSRGVELKAEFLSAHVTSKDYERLETMLPKNQRDEVRRELAKNTTALTFRELARKKGLPPDFIEKLTPESFDQTNFEFPKGGKKVTLGSPEGEEGRDDNEKAREVTLTKPFRLQATDVTNGQYRVYLETTGASPEKLAEINKKDPNEPVVEVSWNDAVAYAKWLSSVDPTTEWRLPSEAEWEFASRAGTNSRYWSGNSVEDLSEVGWHSGNSGGKVHPVAQKRPNPNGLYDVHGNVWKWMQDSYKSVLSKESTVDPIVELSSGSFRVMRGGSWGSVAQYARSASRGDNDPGNRGGGVGFRLAGTPR